MRLFLLLLIGFFVFPKLSYAQTAGISVTPSILRIDLKTELPEALLYYKNTTKSTIELHLRAQDFKELEEDGRLQFLNEKDATNYQYSLSSWIHFTQDSLSLAPGETQTVKILIDKTKLPLGGHYATIFAEISQPDEIGQVRLHGVLSSLLFVRATTGYEREEGKIASSGLDRDWLTFPTNMVLRFQNTGNVETIPHGIIEIKNSQDEIVAKGILNEDSLITLPESIRRFDSSIKQLKPFIPPGKYSANISLQFGNKPKILKQTFTFYSQGSLDLPLLLGVLLLIGGGFFVYRKWQQPFKS